MLGLEPKSYETNKLYTTHSNKSKMETQLYPSIPVSSLISIKVCNLPPFAKKLSEKLKIDKIAHKKQ